MSYLSAASALVIKEASLPIIGAGVTMLVLESVYPFSYGPYDDTRKICIALGAILASAAGHWMKKKTDPFSEEMQSIKNQLSRIESSLQQQAKCLRVLMMYLRRNTATSDTKGEISLPQSFSSTGA